MIIGSPWASGDGGCFGASVAAIGHGETFRENIVGINVGGIEGGGVDGGSGVVVVRRL